MLTQWCDCTGSCGSDFQVIASCNCESRRFLAHWRVGVLAIPRKCVFLGGCYLRKDVSFSVLGVRALKMRSKRRRKKPDRKLALSAHSPRRQMQASWACSGLYRHGVHPCRMLHVGQSSRRVYTYSKYAQFQSAFCSRLNDSKAVYEQCGMQSMHKKPSQRTIPRVDICEVVQLLSRCFHSRRRGDLVKTFLMLLMTCRCHRYHSYPSRRRRGAYTLAFSATPSSIPKADTSEQSALESCQVRFSSQGFIPYQMETEICRR